MPVFHSYNAHHAQQAAFHAMHPQAQHLTLAQHPVSAVAALNYPTAFNIPMQYGQYISLPCNLFQEHMLMRKNFNFFNFF